MNSSQDAFGEIILRRIHSIIDCVITIYSWAISILCNTNKAITVFIDGAMGTFTVLWTALFDDGEGIRGFLRPCRQYPRSTVKLKLAL